MTHKGCWLWSWVVAMLAGNSALWAQEPSAGKQVPQRFVSQYAPAEALNYLLFLPTDYGQQERKWPLLLFLHGAGESGDDLQKVKTHGPPKLVEQRPHDFPFVIVSPQAPITEIPIVDRWQPRLLAELVDHVVSRFAIDPERLYVTGLSMGGYGTIRLVAYYPKKFAAAIPICGGGSRGYGASLAAVPMWFFHGDADLIVPLEQSLEVVRAMRMAGGQPKFTVYSGVGHDSWTATYDNPEIYQWLLQHTLSNRPPLNASRRP
ncbi:MAG: hypothetical protein KatS3mg114_0695 [Planctomycetaceae bacterium]|nr:MAG: hypothetical protein KatS3mg114_0695 [Planctomycetaceae bacterium]